MKLKLSRADHQELAVNSDNSPKIWNAKLIYSQLFEIRGVIWGGLGAVAPKEKEKKKRKKKRKNKRKKEKKEKKREKKKEGNYE